ncbi:MAG: porin family protein [Puniceicoccales bacterium]|jgi:opacity protein-like surface antigen|nr:porin family protein [Puniceicoccales bacterium]
MHTSNMHNTARSSGTRKLPRFAAATLAAAAFLGNIAGTANAAGDEPWANKPAQPAQPAPAYTPPPASVRPYQPAQPAYTAPQPATRPAVRSTTRSYDDGPSVEAFTTLHAGVLLTSFSGDFAKGLKMDSMVSGGATFGGGFRFAKSRVGSILVYGELGVYAGDESIEDDFKTKHGSYYYTYDVDGCKREDLIVPISVLGAYDFNLGTRFSLRAGVHLGATVFTSELKYKGRKIDDFSQTAFSGGIVLGTTWKVSQHWQLDINYKFAANSKIKMMEGEPKASSQTHQINLGVGFRW